MTGTACRRCGEETTNLTTLWKPDRTGALYPYAAQCRGPCGPSGPGVSRNQNQAARTQRVRVFTATRSGLCQVCDEEIFIADKVSNPPETGFCHAECVPGG